MDSLFAIDVPMLEPQHLATFTAEVGEPVAGIGGRWGFFARAQRRLTILDAEGTTHEEVAFGGLPDAAGLRGREGFAFALDADVPLLAHLQADRVDVLSPSGKVSERAHEPWGSKMGAAACFIDRGRELWLAAPLATGSFQIASGQLLRVDVGSGALIGDAAPLADDHPEAYGVELHPSGAGAVFQGAYGQDGSTMWIVRLDDGEWRVDELPAQDKVPGACSPDGSCFAAAPHDADDVAVYAWPNGDEITKLDGSQLFEQETDEMEPDAFYYAASMLDDTHVVTMSHYGRLLVLDVDDVASARWVSLDGYADIDLEPEDEWFEPAGELHWFDVVAPGIVLTHHDSGRFDLWRISP